MTEHEDGAHREDEREGGTVRPSPVPTGDAEEVLELLAEGVPMALLADLADPAGPPSPVILEEEGLPTEPWWEAPEEEAPRETGSDA